MEPMERIKELAKYALDLGYVVSMDKEADVMWMAILVDRKGYSAYFDCMGIISEEMVDDCKEQLHAIVERLTDPKL